jgi:subtilisin family serine protease
MKPIFRTPLSFLILSASSIAVADSSATMHPLARGNFVPQRVIVKYKTPTIQDNFLHELRQASRSNFSGLREMGAVQRMRSLRAQTDLFRFASATRVQDVVEALRQDPRIEWAQPDYYLSIFSNPTTLAGRQATLASLDFGMATLTRAVGESMFARPATSEHDPAASNPIFERPVDAAPEDADDPMLGDLWGLARVGTPSAWDSQRGSREIIVANIDTGVDYNHEDLRHNMWEGLGYDFADKDPFPWDTHGHGSHTAGTIGATGGNGIGISGIAQRASIMAIRFIGSKGYGTTSDAVQSIDFAVENGARVLSNSWGGSPSKEEEQNLALEEAIKRANEADVLFVAAAGNDGRDNDAYPIYPAAMQVPNILTVASINDRDRRSFFSNFGETTVHVGAPGSNIVSAIPGNKYMRNSGTSMACPHVAGLAALILSERPELSALDVKQIIMDSVDPLPSLQGITVSGGLINTSAALERARTFGY